MPATRLPAFQFYPQDIQKDTGYKRCSKAERGAFLDFLCLVHECEFRGVAFDNGSAMTQDEVAEALGGDKAENLGLLGGIIAKGPIKVWSRVASKVGLNTSRDDLCPDLPDGTLYNRRMVRDEIKRLACSDAGKAGGGNPDLKSRQTFKGHPKGVSKGHPKGGPKRKGGSSSSSSSSVSSSNSSSDHNPPLPPKGGRLSTLLEVPEVRKAWEDFLSMRRRMKKPATNRAQELLVDKLEKMTNRDPGIAVAILDQSTLKSWQDLYPLKPEDGYGAHAKHSARPESQVERNARAARENFGDFLPSRNGGVGKAQGAKANREHPENLDL